MGVNVRATEEVSMEATTSSTSSSSSTSSTVVAMLGNTAINNNEILNTTKFTPIYSISKWTDKAQKMVNVAMLLHRGLQEKHTSKVTVAECNNKLEIEMV